MENESEVLPGGLGHRAWEASLNVARSGLRSDITIASNDLGISLVSVASFTCDNGTHVSNIVSLPFFSSVFSSDRVRGGDKILRATVANLTPTKGTLSAV